MKKLLLFLLAALPFLVAAQTVPSYVPTNGLVGWWPFNGNANDLSGNGNNGTVNGATLTTDRFNNASSCYNFDYTHWSWGSGGDEIYIPYNSLMNSSNLTVSVWAQRNSDGYSGQSLCVVNRYQYGYSNPNGQTWGIGLDVAPSCLIRTSVIQAAPNNSQAYISISGPVMTLSNWVHIVMTFDGISAKQYVNGTLFQSLTANGLTLNTAGNSGISVGVSDQANGHWSPFDGKIDDIGIWNRALDSCEIKDLYYSSLGNCCAVSITTQPANQNLVNGNNAVFNVVASGTNTSYQWQTDIGLGFQNLSNAGQYSGVNTATLTVSNITAMNANQAFRCIVADGACSDTSIVAYIFNTTGIEQINFQSQLMVAPNPAHEVLNVEWKNANIKTISLYDASGRSVRTFEVSGTQAQLSLEGIERGIYFLSINGEKRLMKKLLVE